MSLAMRFRLRQLDSHAHIAVFVGNGKAGDLVLTADEWARLHTPPTLSGDRTVEIQFYDDRPQEE